VVDIHESTLVDLDPKEGNGIVTDFATPTAYKAGSIRVFLNGVEYEPTDEKWGWTELNQFQVRLTNAPRTGDVLAAFYQAKDAAEVLGLEDVRGSPFNPGELPP